MGFDVHGLKPSNKEGEYFCANVWHWRPLWDYTMGVCGDLLPYEAREKGHYNDGYVVDADTANKIGLRLQHHLEQRKTEQYKEEREKYLAGLPDEPCNICLGTGRRYDAVVKGPCNGCKGTGKRRPWITEYYFKVEVVTEFAKFCRKSGGFEIY